MQQGITRGPPTGDGSTIEPGLRHGRALSQHLGVHLARYRQRILHVQGDLGIHFFPEPRWPEDHVGCDLAHIIEDRAGVLGEMDGLTLRQWVVGGAHAFRDMAQGQKRQSPVQRLQVQVLLHAVDLEHQVAVADHGPFGRPGGARGVDQKSDVVRLAGVDARVKTLSIGPRPGLTQGQELLKRGGHRVRQITQALEVSDNDVLQCRAVVAHRQGFVVLLLVFDKQHAHCGVLQDVLHLLGR